jgi:putative endopeptidase
VFSLDIYPDAKNPEINTLYIGQAGLGLPDRDYYLTDGFKPQLAAYTAFVERALKMAGYPTRPRAPPTSWPSRPGSPRPAGVAERRDIDKTYNPVTAAELATYAPFPWNALSGRRRHAGPDQGGAGRKDRGARHRQGL